MIQIYNVGNTNFEKNGDMTLFPREAHVNAILNGVWAAYLIHPIDEEGRWKYIQEDCVVEMPSFNGNQLFRIKKKKKSDFGIEAQLVPVFMDAKDDCFLLDVRPTQKTGQQALDIMTEPNGKYSGESDIQKISTAYYNTKNLIQAINGEDENSFVKRWGGEILFDNYKVIINERVGGDYGVKLLYGKNIPQDGIREIVDTNEVVTRIIPKAYNGYMLEGEEPWVDSPLINKYPIIKHVVIEFEDVKMFEDAQEEDAENGTIICQTKQELENALREKCNEQYEKGLDKPTVSIEAEMILLQDTDIYEDVKELELVSLGDTVHCKHSGLDIVSDARVIELEFDSILKKTVSVKIGEFKYNYFDRMSSIVDRVDQAIREDGTLEGNRISGIIDAMKTQLRLQNTVSKKQDVRAILFEDTDPDSELYGAMCLGTQGFQIANKRTADGRDWEWTTFGTANGFVADLIAAGKISDKLGKILWDLDKGEFIIKDDKGNPIFNANAEGGKINIVVDSLVLKGEKVEERLEQIKNDVKKTVKSQITYYYLSTSKDTVTGGSWSQGISGWTEDKYLWMKTTTTYSDGTASTTNPVCMAGATGADGTKTVLADTYLRQFTSAQWDDYLIKETTWSNIANASEYKPKDIIIIKGTITDNNNAPCMYYGTVSSVSGTNVVASGFHLSAGSEGRGIASHTIEFYLSTKKDTPTGGNWGTKQPTWSPGTYLFYRYKIVYKNPASTEYTTPICDSSWEAVNEIEIGGRNIATGTKDEEFVNNKNAAITVSDGRRTKSVKATCTYTSTAADNFSIRQSEENRNIDITSDSAHTLSFLIRGNVTDLNYCYIMNENGQNQGLGTNYKIEGGSISDTEFRKIVFTFIPNANTISSQKSYILIGNKTIISTSMWFEIQELKLEKGNKATDYDQALEDIENRLDEEMSDMQEVITRQKTEIKKECDELVFSALNEYTKSSEFEKFKEYTESELKVLSNQISMKITEVIEKIDIIDGDLQEKYNTITKFFTFDINGLTIGQVDNPNKVVIDNDEITILVNGIPVQRFDSNGVAEIPELHVTRKIDVLGYAEEVDAQGRVNEIYVGG